MDLKENRLSIIIEDIISEGQIDIKSLSKKLKVSTMTIHRDIEEFTKRGVIKKEKGILSSSQIFTLEYFHDVRAKLNIHSKIKVAEEAVKIIQPNTFVGIDDSTTCLQFANFQKYFEGTTVVTNNIKLINIFSSNPKIKIISLGGRYNRPTGSFLGLSTENTASQIPCHYLFMSSSSLDGTKLYTHDEDVFRTKAIQMINAEKKYYLCDTTKIGKKAMNIQADLSEFEKCFFAGPYFDKSLGNFLKKRKVNFKYFKIKS